MTELVQKCPKLTSLVLYDCTQLTDACIFEMAEYCLDLVKLQLHGRNPHITAEGLFRLGTKCAKLKEVTLEKEVDYENEKQTLMTQIPHVEWDVQLYFNFIDDCGD